MSFRLQQVTVGEYYRYLYPYETLVAWLTMHGHALERFEFAIDGEYYSRFNRIATADQLRKTIGSFPGVKAFHIGGIWPEVCDRRVAPTQRILASTST